MTTDFLSETQAGRQEKVIVPALKENENSSYNSVANEKFL